MSLLQMKADIEELKSQLKKNEDASPKKGKLKAFKFPSIVKRKSKKSIKEGKFLICYLKNILRILFKYMKIILLDNAKLQKILIQNELLINKKRSDT